MLTIGPVSVIWLILNRPYLLQNDWLRALKPVLKTTLNVSFQKCQLFVDVPNQVS